MQQKLQQFMYGRYGGDAFSVALLVMGFVLSTIGSITVAPLVILAYFFYAYAIYRALSRNIAARQGELRGFQRVWTPIRSWCAIQKRKFTDRKTFRYFHCPHCKQHLRAPKGRGSILVTCQSCHHEFTKKV